MVASCIPALDSFIPFCRRRGLRYVHNETYDSLSQLRQMPSRPQLSSQNTKRCDAVLCSNNHYGCCNAHDATTLWTRREKDNQVPRKVGQGASPVGILQQEFRLDDTAGSDFALPRFCAGTVSSSLCRDPFCFAAIAAVLNCTESCSLRSQLVQYKWKHLLKALHHHCLPRRYDFS